MPDDLEIRVLKYFMGVSKSLEGISLEYLNMT